MSQAEVCSSLATVRQDFDQIETSASKGDAASATKAMNDARNRLTAVRDGLQSSQQQNPAAATAAADLIGAFNGLQTTMRQAGQGGGSIQGVVQQLTIQLTSMSSALANLRQSLGCS